MIRARLLHVVVQPVYVLLDDETYVVRPGPPVEAHTITADAVDQIGQALELTRMQIEQMANPGAG